MVGAWVLGVAVLVVACADCARAYLHTATYFIDTDAESLEKALNALSSLEVIADASFDRDRFYMCNFSSNHYSDAFIPAKPQLNEEIDVVVFPAALTEVSTRDDLFVQCMLTISRHLFASSRHGDSILFMDSRYIVGSNKLLTYLNSPANAYTDLHCLSASQIQGPLAPTAQSEKLCDFSIFSLSVSSAVSIYNYIVSSRAYYGQLSNLARVMHVAVSQKLKSVKLFPNEEIIVVHANQFFLPRPGRAIAAIEFDGVNHKLLVNSTACSVHIDIANPIFNTLLPIQTPAEAERQSLRDLERRNRFEFHSELARASASAIRPRVFNCILLNDELSQLAFRLEHYASVFDHFIVVESGHTFDHTPKPMHLAELMKNHSHLLGEGRNRIVAIQYELNPAFHLIDSEANSWRACLHGLQALHPVPTDVVVLTRSDEFPQLEALQRSVETVRLASSYYAKKGSDRTAAGLAAEMAAAGQPVQLVASDRVSLPLIIKLPLRWRYDEEQTCFVDEDRVHSRANTFDLPTALSLQSCDVHYPLGDKSSLPAQYGSCFAHSRMMFPLSQEQFMSGRRYTLGFLGVDHLFPRSGSVLPQRAALLPEALPCADSDVVDEIFSDWQVDRAVFEARLSEPPEYDDSDTLEL